MKTVAIFEDVHKTYRVRAGGYGTLRDLLANPRLGGRGDKVIRALQGVSLRLEEGEAVAIIGRNGAGKTTILKLLSRITQPDSGTIQVRGKVAPLIEVGAGFHPELTGRENVLLNGAILGLSRQEIERRFDEIVEFAGLREYIDVPLKKYSSGMHVRLGFSVAVHTDPALLLVDEVLAVGDYPFQMKCLDRVRSMRESGTAILFVTHNLGVISTLCDRALYLTQGAPRFLGPTEDAVRLFKEDIAFMESSVGTREQRPDEDSRHVHLLRVELLDGTGAARDSFESGEPAIVRIHYDAPRPVRSPVFLVEIYSTTGTLACGMNTSLDRCSPEVLEGRGSLELHLDRLDLIEGAYGVGVQVREELGWSPYDLLPPALTPLRIAAGGRAYGEYAAPHRWVFP
jgi:ABC-type polysaccharide/polyol phosphate transport system ATPase subunit